MNHLTLHSFPALLLNPGPPELQLFQEAQCGQATRIQDAKYVIDFKKNLDFLITSTFKVQNFPQLSFK